MIFSDQVNEVDVCQSKILSAFPSNRKDYCLNTTKAEPQRTQQEDLEIKMNQENMFSEEPQSEELFDDDTIENNQQLSLNNTTVVCNKNDIIDRNRMNALHEIYSTEVEYVKNLQILLEYYIVPLEEESNPILNDVKIAVFFSNLRQLVTLNSKFLDDLEELMTNYDVKKKKSTCFAAESIGELFCRYAPLFTIYAGYATCFEGALGKIRLYKLSNIHSFGDHLIKSKEKSKSRQSFEDFLIRPIQRVPQYRLLLQSILNCTSVDTPDRKYISQAVEKISDAASLINDTIRQNEAREDVLATQAQFGGQVSLLTHDRVLIKSGAVLKVSRKGPQSVYLHLFNDLLLYSAVLMYGGFRLRRSINLRSQYCKVTETLPHTCSSICADHRELDRNNGFMIRSAEKSFMIFANSLVERTSWVTNIREAIQKCCLQTGGVQPSTLDDRDPAALWVPDSLADQCPICHTVFTMLFRRHHCRRCGCVICGQCSGKRTIFCRPDPSQEHRICNRCDRILNLVENICQKWLSLLVIHQGWLFRKRGKKWNKYFFQLKKGILRQYSMAPGRRSGDRTPLDEIDLTGAIVVRRADRAKRYPYCFHISLSSTVNNSQDIEDNLLLSPVNKSNSNDEFSTALDIDQQNVLSFSNNQSGNCAVKDGCWIVCAHSSKEEKEWVDILQQSADAGILQVSNQVKLPQTIVESTETLQEKQLEIETLDESLTLESAKIERRRHDILKEIVRSESSYVSCLGECIDVFVKPLFLRQQAGDEYLRRTGKSKKCIRMIETTSKRSPIFSPRAALGRWTASVSSPPGVMKYERSPSMPTKPLILDANLAVFFNSMEQIFTLNAHLLDHLTRHLSETSESSTDKSISVHRVGAIFNAYAPLFTLYTVYASRYETALQAIDSCDFKEFLNEMPPEATHHRLTTYLNMPMDRIPRYKVILQELAECTFEGHIDFTPLMSSIEKVNMAVKFIHEKIADRENWEKVVSIQQAYGGINKIQLLMKGRRFCKEGFLRKICRKDIKVYNFVLFNNALVYGHQISANSFRHHRTIDFWNCRLVNVTSTSLVLSQAAGLSQETMSQNSFEIHSPSKSFVVVAATAQEKKSWMEAIQECLDSVAEIPTARNKIKDSFDEQINPLGLTSSCSLEESSPNLAPDDSMIIKTGWANVHCHRQNKVVRRWLVLTKCRLTFFRTFKTAVPYASLDLSTSTLLPSESTDGKFVLKASLVPIGPYKDFKFLNGMLGMTEFTFLSDSETNAMEWHKAIMFCAAGDAHGYLEAAQKSLRNQPLHAPIFMFDKESQLCTICDSSFSLFRRKHHCRRCGNLICRSCSRNKWVLAHIDQSRLSRICDNCASNVSREYSEELAINSLLH